MKKFLLVLPALWLVVGVMAQPVFQATEVRFPTEATLTDNFRAFEVFRLDADAIDAYVKAQGLSARVSVQFGDVPVRDFTLYKQSVLSENYSLRVATERGVEQMPFREIGTYRGYVGSDHGATASLTIEPGFFFGFWQEHGEEWFVEPLYRMVPGAARDLYILYRSADVLEHNDFCGVSMTEHQMVEYEAHEKSVQMQCYSIEIALAADFAMVTALGGVTQVVNFMAGVLNNVQTNYDNEFDNQYQFATVTTFVSNCSTCDPWTASTNSSDLLPSFRTWGNNNGFGTTGYDVASLWSNRNFDGSTIGLAYVGVACGSFRYNILQNFSTNANFLRVLQAHELGHNFNATHDPSGSTTIMAPSVNSSTTWSAQSLGEINPFLGARHSPGCLAICPASPPVAQAVSSHSSVCPGSVVHFFDISTGGVTSRAWSFPGGTPSTSTLQHPRVTYNTPGTYTATMTASNSAGFSTTTVTIVVADGHDKIILNESFEQGNSWTVVNPDNNITWALEPISGNNSSVAMVVENYFYDAAGEIDQLLTPVLDFSQETSIQFNMQYAFRRYSNGYNDTLRIRISTDGGASFPTLLFQGIENGSGNFATGPDLTDSFSPTTADDWCTNGPGCINLDLTAYAGQSNVVIAIENGCDYGNNMFIDNIVVSSACASVTADFSGTPTVGCAPLTVEFTDASFDNPTDWNWTFEGGNPASSAAQNPEVEYTIPGTYDVTLEVLNGSASDALTRTDYITVQGGPTAGFSFSNTPGSLAVTFTNTSSNSTSQTWHFGDGNTSGSVSPTHTYTAAGTYTVMLIATNGCGSDTLTQQVTLILPPVAAIAVAPSTGCAPLSVTYTASPQATGHTYNWTFTGGTPASSTLAVVNVTYANPGTYGASLTVTNAAGSNTASQGNAVTVTGPPTAAFTQSNTAGSLTVNFTNTSVGATSYSWNFGDGNSSTATSPSHTYATPGVYSVQLTATNACGSTSTTQSVTVVILPVASISATPTTGCAPLTVTYTGLPDGPGHTFSWSFPGGSPTTAATRIADVTYNSAGNYGASLTVSNAAGSDTETVGSLVTVTTVPTVSFSLSNTPGSLVVSFTNASSNANSYSWNFGDGNTSTQENPTHTYTSAGTFTITLEATNACGSTTTTQQVTLILPPVASFTAAPADGCSPLSVTYTASPQGAGYTYSWTFPGGNPSSSTNATVVVVYTTAGSYGASLTVTNAAGTDTETQAGVVTVSTVPQAVFSMSNTPGSPVVVFGNQSVGATSYSWNFGDGNTSSLTDPTHSYGSAGTYTVQLTATNTCGSHTSSQTITIYELPVASMTVTPEIGCAPLSVSYSASPQGAQYTYQWSFPGGNPTNSTLPSPTVLYNAPGLFDATLTVSNPAGADVDTRAGAVEVLTVPVAGFTLSSTPGSLQITFINTSAGATSYSWNFGDGNTSTLENPDHTYDMGGNYTVQLTATNSCGSNTISIPVTVVSQPVASISVSQASGCAPLSVTYSAAQAFGSSYSWSFPGGTPATSTNPVVTVVYPAPGFYDATLSVSNMAGTDVQTISGAVEVITVPVAGFTVASTPGNLQITLINTSIGATSYSWNFGDGNTSTLENPDHTYAAGGNYTVQLTATNSCGSNTINIPVTVVNQPVASISVSQNLGCAPLTVTYTAAQAFGSSYSWSFPGGSPATSTNPVVSVVYTNPGIYEATLSVSNVAGTDVQTLSGVVEVITVPVAGFTIASTPGSLQVGFTNTSSGATSYSWNFGDGNNSTLENPDHTYSTGGNYTVQLTATNVCGNSTVSIPVTVVNQPVASMSVSQTSGCAPLTVTYSAAQAFGSSYSWSFPGGNPATSTNPVVTVVYVLSGVYDATLSVSNAAGTDVETISGAVEVITVPVAGFSFDNDPGSLITTFFNTSSGATSYVWDFGDGFSSTLVNPTHVYSTAGTYTVQLTANNVCGSQSVTAQVTIILPPVPVISASPTTGCAPLTVSYTAAPQVAGQSYAWNFPGGTPAFSVLPEQSVVYSTPGVYGASLTITNAAGPGIVTENALVEVITVPSVAFTYQYTPGSLTVGLQNNTTGATSYVWTFGDGAVSDQEHPTHQFPGAGIYTVTLRAINACGFTETSLPIEIILPPVASFTAVPNTGCAPHTVQYMAMPLGSAFSYAWTFPGGNPSSSTEANPQVNYTLPGIYGATLVVTNIAGSDTVTVSDAVEVITVPVAAFVVGSTAGSLEINLQNHSSGATAYVWDFGDGQTSNAVNPTHVYTTDGDYTITLRAINACGEESTQRLVNLFLPPLPGISISDTLGCMPMTVVYRASPQREGHTFAWNFPGGNPTVSTDSVVSVTYSQVGQYSVSLEVTNPAGSSIQQIQDMVRVITTPTAAFAINDTPGSLQVSLTNNSIGADRFEWIFSDGGTAELPEPMYSFPLPGMYTVTLRAINQCGVDTLSAEVSVDTPLPIPLFSVVGGQGCAPLTVQFTNQTIAGDSYQWSFPGGTPSSSTDINPVVTYTTPGVYDVTLLATNVAGNAAITRVQVVRVLGLPDPTFSASIATDTVSFTNQSIGGQSYAWQFGDGGTQTEESPVWIYGNPGTYRVVLRATNTCGSAEAEQMITLSGALPEADFIVDTLVGCVPLTVTYTDRTPGDIRFRQWAFDGGSPATGNGESTMVTYTTPGIYAVSLVVGNFYGRDTLTRSDYLLVDGEPEIEETQVVSERPDDPAWLSYTFNATALGEGLQYVWIIEGLDTLEGPSLDYVFPGPGIYVVRLVVTNACGIATVQAGIVDILISGTREVVNDLPWQVYPNPGYGQYRISLEGKQTFRVLDVLGRLVWRGILEGPVAVLDMADKPGGVYWVVDDKGRYVKLIKR